MPKKQSMTGVEKALEEAGTFGVYQVWLMILIFLPYILVGANMGAIIFEGMTPTFHCDTNYSEWIQQIRHLIVSDAPNVACNAPRLPGSPTIFGRKWPKCNLSQENQVLPASNYRTESECFKFAIVDEPDTSCSYWRLLTNNDTIPNNENVTAPETISCDAWTFDKSVMQETIVTEFSLVCKSTWASYISQSAFMFGMLVGNIAVGWISDRVGRKNALLLGGMGTLIFGVATSFTKSYLTFAIVRAIMGVFVYTMFPVVFVLVSELVVAKHRAAFAQYAEANFAVGLILLSLLAYCTRDWRKLQLALSIPAGATAFLWWLLPESPRWLLSNDKQAQAVDVIKKISHVNRTWALGKSSQRQALDDEETENYFMNLITKQDENHSTASDASNKDEMEDQGDDLKINYGPKDLIRTPQLRRESFVQFYQWFAVSSVYYGLTLNAAELGVDPFFNLAMNGMFEAIADIFVIPLANKVGRRLCGSVSQVFAGLFCILLAYVPHDVSWLYVGCSLIGKFFISLSFSIMFIQVSEIYPTPVRSIAGGICSAWARFGGIASPLIAMSGILVPSLPYVIFAVLAVFSGILVLAVPETKKQPLCETVEDAEKFIASNPGPLLQLLRRCR